jgi:class 3 adenylate cyclase
MSDSGQSSESSDHIFLFADLVGYTALADQHGDERAAEVALGLHRKAQELAPMFGTRQIKTLGDGLMARCADPAAGIGFGLALVEELESERGFPPIRVGVHCGTAVERDGDWYGRGVNVAARLCSAAVGGQVLVSESTLRAAGELPKVEVGERRLHWLRNVTEPIAARTASWRRNYGLARIREGIAVQIAPRAA